jgi:isoquinoline 1-oxidoreductase beta subunit
MRVATAGGLGSAIARLAGGEDRDALDTTALDGSVPPYAIPNVAVEATHVPVPFRTGYMRGHPQRPLVFAVESFVDELARIAGVEPLAFRMALLGGNPRLARCAQTAAARAGWDGGASGSTMGLAAASLFGSHVALVASASLAADQSIEVHRLVAAVDCGRIVNPQLVRQQIEGGLLWALGLASVRAPEFSGGVAKARPLGELGLPRLERTPEILVELIAGDAAPGGVSGLGPAILAPALANAIHAGTGRRLRSLPFDPMAVG